MTLFKKILTYLFIFFFTSLYLHSKVKEEQNKSQKGLQENIILKEMESKLDPPVQEKEINFWTKKLLIRFLGGIGYLTGNPLNVIDGDLLNYSGNFQLAFQFHDYFSVGLETSYWHAFSFRNNFSGQEILKKENLPKNGLGDYNFLSPLIFVDFLPRIFHIQLGLGPYFLLNHGFSDTSELSNTMNVFFGVFLSFGFEIKLASFVYIPVSTRFQFVFLDPVIIPVEIFTGLSFKVPL